MERQQITVSGSGQTRHRAATVVAWLALLAACAGFAIPGKTGELSGISTILAVAAIATLAGHGWGILVVAAADVALVAEVWPIVANLGTIAGTTNSDWTRLGAGFALALAAPGLVVFAVTLPRTVAMLVGRRSGRRHTVGLAAAAIATCAYLAVPATRAAMDHGRVKQAGTSAIAPEPAATAAADQPQAAKPEIAPPPLASN